MSLIENLKNSTLEKIQKNGFELRNSSSRVRDNKEIVLMAVKQEGCSLKYASKRLKEDKEVVLEAVKQNGWSLKYASDELQNDKILLEILEKEDLEILIVQESERSWYQQRIEVLANIREKELIENSITPSNKLPNKVKF